MLCDVDADADTVVVSMINPTEGEVIRVPSIVPTSEIEDNADTDIDADADIDAAISVTVAVVDLTTDCDAIAVTFAVFVATSILVADAAVDIVDDIVEFIDMVEVWVVVFCGGGDDEFPKLHIVQPLEVAVVVVLKGGIIGVSVTLKDPPAIPKVGTHEFKVAFSKAKRGVASEHVTDPKRLTSPRTPRTPTPTVKPKASKYWLPAPPLVQGQRDIVVNAIEIFVHVLSFAADHFIVYDWLSAQRLSVMATKRFDDSKP